MTIGSFRIVWKICRDIYKSRCTTGINDTGVNVVKLTQVSMTPAAIFATGTAGVVDTGGKFATSINNTGGK
jgi:hypothetical protein